MNRSKTVYSVLLSVLVLLVALLAGCGAAPSEALYHTEDLPAASAPAAAPAAPQEAAADTAAGADMDAVMAEAGGGPTLSLPQDNRKVVLTANLELEAQDFDATCGKLQQSAEALGGYIAAADVRGNADIFTRYATFTVKIPAEKYAEFLSAASSAGNLLSRSEQSEDVTDSYTDVEARLKSLRTQEERLLDLMRESGKLEDLIMIQNQLTQVQYEIESYTAQQRNLDNRIAYSTVYLSVDEVDQITPPKTDDSFGARIAKAFEGTWQNVLLFLQWLVISLVWLLPLLIVAVVALVVVLAVLKKQRKKRAENPPAQPPYPNLPYNPAPPHPAPPAAPAAPHETTAEATVEPDGKPGETR